MKKIFAITDYKGHFGSKWQAEPYRSGFDKRKLAEVFKNQGYDLDYVKPVELCYSFNWHESNVIYTSSEEHGYHYKDYLEDCILSLQLAGANLMPCYSFLRANNNKVFMELLREQWLGQKLSGIKSYSFGTLEELLTEIEKGAIDFPVVIKEAAGAMSRGVYLAKTKDELIRYAKKISKTASLNVQIKEKLRVKKHGGYKPESFYQKKFIVQPFIPGLSNDWKILIFGDHYYILKRGIKSGDFRASGSGKDYKSGADADFPASQFDMVEQIYQKLDVPMLSLDYAFDGNRGYLLEFQAVYFGTATHSYCGHYCVKRDQQWVFEEKKMSQEEEYAYSVAHYLNKKGSNGKE